MPQIRTLLIAFTLLLTFPAIAAAQTDDLTRAVIGHGTIVASSTPPRPAAPACTSPASTPQGVQVNCPAIGAASFGTCNPQQRRCDIALTAQAPAGWAFDRWTGGQCAGTNPICFIQTLEVLCGPNPDEPDCQDHLLGPWTVIAVFRDVRAPTVAINAAPAQNSVVLSDSRQQTITFSTNEDEEAPRFQCQRDGGAFAPCTSPLTLNGLADGIHDFCVRATDASGLPSINAPCRRWEQETNPTAAIVSGPAALTTAKDAAFTYNSNKTTHVADGFTLGFECTLDGAPFEPCLARGITFAGLSDGPHEFRVRSVFHGPLDPPGVNHRSAETLQAWTVDTTPPDTTITSGPAEGATIVDNAPTFEFTTSEAGSTFTCEIDDEPAVPCTSPLTTLPLESGPHTFTVTSTDAIGNADPTPATRTFTLAVLQPPPTDADGDGFPEELDCNDDDASINPGRAEIPGNNVDENCDGVAAPFPRIPALHSVAGSANTTRTTFTRMLATEVPEGGKVEVRCSGPQSACPFARKAVAVKNGKANALTLLAPKQRKKGLKFGVGATVELRMTATGFIGKVVRFKIVKGVFPRGKVLCLAPGVTKPAACR